MLFQTLLSTVEQKNKIFQIMFQLYSESGSGERSTQIKILSTEIFFYNNNNYNNLLLQ